MLIRSQIKYIQTLSQKKLRDEEGVFVAEGPKSVSEFLQSPRVRLRQLFATNAWVLSHDSLLERLPKDALTVVDEKELERISFLSTPNEVLALFEKPQFSPQPTDRGSLVLLLDTVQDPGNLGTIIRSADWFGLHKIICSEDAADAFNPKVVQASMGSLSRVQVVYTDLNTYLSQNPGMPVYAAVMDGADIASIKKPEEGYLLIGNESKGIRRSLLDQGNLIRVTIPRRGQAESLNAAVAAGILLSYLT